MRPFQVLVFVSKLSLLLTLSHLEKCNPNQNPKPLFPKVLTHNKGYPNNKGIFYVFKI